MVHLEKKQMCTYLIENMSCLNLNSYASIVHLQSNLPAKFSNNPRIFIFIHICIEENKKKEIMMFSKTFNFFQKWLENRDLFLKRSYFQLQNIVQNKNPVSV